MNEILQQITERYHPDEDGIIVRAGKYEGAMYYVPYFWESRTPDKNEGTTRSYSLTNQDRFTFPELQEAKELIIEENPDGSIAESLAL